MRKLTTEDVRRKLRAINPNIGVLGKYKHSQLPIACRCLICGNKWKPLWSNLSQGRGCPKCALKASRLSDHKVRERLKKIAPTIRLMEKYRGAMVRVKCKCITCGHTWRTIWASLNYGRGCPKCGMDRVREALTLSSSEVKRRLKKLIPTVKITGKYKSSNFPLPCLCMTCGYAWSPVWQSLSQGVGCPKCSRIKANDRSRYTLAEIASRLQEVAPHIRLLSKEYKNSYSPLSCKCVRCNRLWKVSWDNLKQGHGCPNCQYKSEEEVRRIFEKLTSMKFLKASPSDVPWLHGLYLDGYCPDMKSDNHPNGVAFEYQGAQHYRPHWAEKNTSRLLIRKRNDHRKRLQCWRHGVRLICIPYRTRDVESFVSKRLQKKKKRKSNCHG